MTLPQDGTHRVPKYVGGDFVYIFQCMYGWFHKFISVLFVLHHSFCCALQQVHSLFQNESSTEGGWSSASSLNFQYLPLSLRSYSSFLRLLPRLPVPSILPSIYDTSDVINTNVNTLGNWLWNSAKYFPTQGKANFTKPSKQQSSMSLFKRTKPKFLTKEPDLPSLLKGCRIPHWTHVKRQKSSAFAVCNSWYRR